MVLWGIIEITVSAVGGYNVIKGIYNMYCDAEKIKRQYREHQKITEQYRAQNSSQDQLTESTYQRFEGEFLILNKSCIIDPYNIKLRSSVLLK